MRKEWEGFVAGNWTENIDVEEFIKLNYHPYVVTAVSLQDRQRERRHAEIRCMSFWLRREKQAGP